MCLDIISNFDPNSFEEQQGVILKRIKDWLS